MKRTKLIYLVVAVLGFALYLIYAYNGLKGRSYIFEPVYISIKGEFPENTQLLLVYQTINDPTANRRAHLLPTDSLSKYDYIFRIDSSYRVANFTLYFQSLQENQTCTLYDINASAVSSSAESSFSLKKKDLIATHNLSLEPLSDSTIILRKISTEAPQSAALHFSVRSSFDEVFVKTEHRKPETPSLLSSVFILILGVMMVYILYPMIKDQKLEGISIGAYILAIAILILPTGEKICNLLLPMAILAGIITSIRKGRIRSMIIENRYILILSIGILFIYLLAMFLARNEPSPGNLMVIKLGLPMTLVAVAVNTNSTEETRIQYTALVTGVVVSIFIHFGWIVMLVDSVEIKSRLLSNPHHFLETSVFSRVHHTYLSVIYLVGLVIIVFQRELILLRKKEAIVYSLVVVIALLFAFSRAAILSLALILIYIALRKILELRKLDITHFARIFTAAVSGIALLAFIFIDFKVDPSSDSYSIKGIDTRFQIWENASELIRQKPITGWGPVNYSAALQEINNRYIINSNTWTRLNTHNQFLESSGIFGLVVGMCLLCFLYFPTGFTRQSKRFAAYIFAITIIFVSAFLFESFLHRNLGILIFGIVFGLLIKTIPGSSDNRHLNKA